MAKRGAEVAGVARTDLDREQLHELYYWLWLTREVEQVLTNLYRQNKVIGGLYRSLGQEAGAVGTAFALRRRADGTGDVMSPAIRDLGAMLLMGADAADVMKQYMAKGDGPTGGRETNVHFSDYQNGYVGLISHLGVMVGVMAGVALSFRLRQEDRVAMVYSGDGMTSTGAFHEGLNLAAVRRLPLICVVENNLYAYSTPTSRQTAAESFVAKADGYGIRGERVDGNDVIAVYEATKRAVAHARAGGGPTLLELMTYRMKGHAEHDGQQYVPAGELDEWQARDPVAHYERWLLEGDHATEPELEAVRERVAGEVDRARGAAESSPMPDPMAGIDDVYAATPGWTPWTRRARHDPHEA
ncbi:MAG TPA: thiamine pyrophosphate-dependent dehydrogenase E1 component subunit alpha [Longimicrobiales bacterium]|nr:thiamine pyrophosphate-dependent dehydrogenase E1 component subunit alpha [Longimicrobiales bacterium]